jgi:hypothetical protein
MSPMEKKLKAMKDAEQKGTKPEKTKKKVVKAKAESKEVKKPLKGSIQKKVPVDAKSDGKIELKTICGQLNLDPKAARRILRNSKLDFHADRGRWAFTEKQAESVKALLTKK